MNKDKNKILESLENNIPVDLKNKMELSNLRKEPTDEKLVSDTEEDFEFARDRIKKLIGTSDEAISLMHNLAADAEHPRAFEVLGTMIKQASEMNGQLLDLQKQRKALVKDKEKRQTSTTNNSIFVGTTSELQKLLKDSSEESPVIDVE